MKYAQTVCRRCTAALMILTIWLAIPVVALAAPSVVPQSDSSAGGKGGGCILMTYCITAFPIAVGIALAARACHRRDRSRPEQYTSLYDEEKLDEGKVDGKAKDKKDNKKV
jgi:hypothetical protein